MKKMTIALLVIISMMFTISVIAQEAAKTKEAVKTTEKAESKVDMDKVSYAIGTIFGKNIKSVEFDMNLDKVSKAMKDVYEGKTPEMTEEEIQQVITDFQVKVREKMTAKRETDSKKNLTEGKAFLEANKKKEGVKTTASGLQYKIIKEGTGAKPSATDKVKVNYKGTLINGTVFDSSYERKVPAEFVADQVIKGWTEALQLMKVGTKAEVYIPSDLAYGEQGAGGEIGPNSTLIFEIELLDILKNEPATDAKPTINLKPDTKATKSTEKE